MTSGRRSTHHFDFLFLLFMVTVEAGQGRYKDTLRRLKVVAWPLLFREL